MIDEKDTPPPSIEPVSELPSTEAPSANLDLDAFLQEYDQAVGAKQEGPLLQQTAPERDYGADLRGSMQTNRDLLEMRLWAEGVQEERLGRREHEDREEAFAQAEKCLQGIEHLPEDYGRRWLIAQASLDPELHHDWHHRYESADDMRRCQNTLRRTLNKLREEASRMPDPDATADRAAVVDAMTRGRSSGTIEAKAPDLSRMSDQEFQAYKETIGLWDEQ